MLWPIYVLVDHAKAPQEELPPSFDNIVLLHSGQFENPFRLEIWPEL